MTTMHPVTRHSHSHKHNHSGQHNQHHHGHKGGHCQHGSATGLRLVAVIILTTTILVAEIVGAFWSGSLALLADAGHMATDSVGLVMAGLALWWGQRKATQLATYGFSRAEVIASALNALLVMAIAVWIVFAAVRRIHDPAELSAEVMLVVATIGLLANLLAMLVLHKPSQDSLNIKGAYLHIVSDMLSSIGVIFASAVVWVTGWGGVDIAVSVLILAVLLPRCWQLLRQSLSVLMQHAPAGLDYVTIQRELLRIPGIERVYDLHLWSLTGSDAVATVHVVITQPTAVHQPDSSQRDVMDHHETVLRRVEAVLRDTYGITRTTIQIELAPHRHVEHADRAAAHHPHTAEHQGWRLWEKTAVTCTRNWRAHTVSDSKKQYHITA
ncbi:cation diffusion facilitator family transporter [Corynebacterium propinquum]|uniref:Cation diffusion facilitator family transporter n=1 Tax=Corynebacterium propinquum TaxID=43769 RepID=A0AAP4BUK6_9CORY|nr:cation diffusion facilitator family transporter [Corynebacterium propinquum]MDK4326652.1 cation diffusion facilitator family transporter [Corynebacterium propinquum]MDK8723601.1 cation diffusion facilitator family transporter [Corynebacterium propinquum]WKS27052.1 cation diffusion facilitator family transporter [Corynebacterium propinquum]WKS33639.1 cation diffusion facilitator family transporter [Corynebacterium propinquum]WKS40208.1 cation diffusion facilitator family transporter [Coryneb